MITGGTSTAALFIFIFGRNLEEEDHNHHSQEIELPVDPPLVIEQRDDHQEDQSLHNVEENHQQESQTLDAHEDVPNVITSSHHID